MSTVSARHQLKKETVGKWFLSFVRFVVIFGLAFIIIKPFIYKIMMAFMSPDDLLDSTVHLVARTPSLYYWQRAWEGLNLSQTLPNTLLLSLGVAVIQVLSCTMIGYGLARFRFFGNKILSATVIVIILVPYHVISIAQYLGFVYFGIGNLTINLVDTFWPMLILAFTGLGIKEGLYIYLLQQFFRSIPLALEEAAYIDGAGTIRTFFQVMLPNARTMMMTVFLFSFCWQWTDSTYSSIYFNELPVFANTIESFYIRVGLNADMLGTNIARNTMAILIIIPLLVLFGFGQKLLVKSITLSGMAN